LTGTAIIKYPGGKRKIAGCILAELGNHERWGVYVEPFAGGLAVLWSARAAGYSGPAVVGEVNPWVRGLWQAIQSGPDAVMSESVRCRDFVAGAAAPQIAYYELRDAIGRSVASASEAGRLLFVLRAGFNGLVRMGPNGPNVPAGSAVKQGKPVCLPSLDDVRRASADLMGVTICGSAHEALSVSRELGRAAIYADPPYVDTHDYSAGWKRSHRRDLAALLAERARGGDRVVVSERATEQAMEDLAVIDPDPVRLEVRHSISRSADGRVLVAEGLWRGGPVP
jgi:site-specific DNA-adenine methylase